MENENTDITIKKKFGNFFKETFILIVKILWLPFEIIYDFFKYFKNINELRKLRKELIQVKKTEIKNSVLSRKIVPEFKFLAEFFPHKEFIFKDISNTITSFTALLGVVVSFLIPFGLLWAASNIISKYSEEFLFVLLVLPIIVGLFLLDTLIRSLIRDKGEKGIIISPAISLLTLILVGIFLLSIILFYINSSVAFQIISVCILLLFIGLLLDALIVIQVILESLLIFFISNYRESIKTLEKSLRILFFNLSDAMQSQNLTIEDLHEPKLTQFDEEDYAFFNFNKKEYILRSKFFFDELLALISENYNNSSLEEWLNEALGEISYLCNRQDLLFEPIIRSMIEYVKAKKALSENNYIIAEEKFKNAIKEWNKIRFKKLKIWSNYFLVEIQKIKVKEERDPKKKTKRIDRISQMYYNIFKSLWKKDYVVYIGWLTHSIYFLTRSARGGDKPKLVKKAKNFLNKIKKSMHDSEKELVLFHSSLIDCVDQYTLASHDRAESRQYHINAIDALDDAQQYFDATYLLLKHDYILKDTWEKIDSKIREEKPQVIQIQSRKNRFLNIMIYPVIAFFIYLQFELILGERILLDLSTRNLGIISAFVLILIIILDIARGEESKVRKLFR